MQDNRLVLAGVVKNTPQTRHTPAGIPITRFTLCHDSIQQEAGMQRQAVCQIGVVVSGEQLHRQLAGLAGGEMLRVGGFLARANHRNGEYRLILHAQMIERANAVTS